MKELKKISFLKHNWEWDGQTMETNRWTCTKCRLRRESKGGPPFRNDTPCGGTFDNQRGRKGS